MGDNIYYSPRLQETSIIHNHLNNIEFSMKRVVKSGASKDINAEDCKRGHVYIGENCHKEWFVVLPLPKGEYALATPDEIADYIPIKPNTFASLVDLFDYFQGIQFYQFPDFRSAMEYYLEQSK